MSGRTSLYPFFFCYLLVGWLFAVALGGSYLFAPGYILVHGGGIFAALLTVAMAVGFGLFRAVVWLPSLLWFLWSGAPGGFWKWCVPGFFITSGN